ncbi:hypothetical protein BJX64DRAFT_292390 [Aspergillus heterothallicus]
MARLFPFRGDGPPSSPGCRGPARRISCSTLAVLPQAHGAYSSHGGYFQSGESTPSDPSSAELSRSHSASSREHSSGCGDDTPPTIDSAASSQTQCAPSEEDLASRSSSLIRDTALEAPDICHLRGSVKCRKDRPPAGSQKKSLRQKLLGSFRRNRRKASHDDNDTGGGGFPGGEGGNGGDGGDEDRGDGNDVGEDQEGKNLSIDPSIISRRARCVEIICNALCSFSIFKQVKKASSNSTH